MKKVMVVSLIILVLAVTAIYVANGLSNSKPLKIAPSVYTQLDAGKPITLSFPGYRVRVNGWDRNDISVEGYGKSLATLQSVFENNALTVQFDGYTPPLWEPAFRVMVPQNIQIIVDAKEAWLQDCVVAKLSVQKAHVRDSSLPSDLESKLSAVSGKSWRSINF